MRIVFAAALLMALGLGCSKKPNRPPAPRLPDTPSALVHEPPRPTGPTDETLFSLPKDRLYVISGTWRNRSDPLKGDYQRPGEFSFARADEADVDPKEIARYVNRWIDGAGVRVINQLDSPADADRIQRTIDYQTERTSGRLDFIIRPAVPAKNVVLSIDVHERRR